MINHHQLSKYQILEWLKPRPRKVRGISGKHSAFDFRFLALFRDRFHLVSLGFQKLPLVFSRTHHDLPLPRPLHGTPGFAQFLLRVPTSQPGSPPGLREFLGAGGASSASSGAVGGPRGGSSSRPSAGARVFPGKPMVGEVGAFL